MEEVHMAVRAPLKEMKIRGGHPRNSFGMVRIKDDGKTPKPHQGWDLQAAVGTPVYAVAHGEVLETTGDVGDYGKSITLAFLESGKWYFAFYAHLSSVLCRKGDAAYAGQLLGLTGKTGNAGSLAASQDHLHFEIRTTWKRSGGLDGRVDPGQLLGYDLYQTRL
jgi:murein DD-endopeptidase MepM/ murein hydrolase activator NlpD